jgi:hypothetical protein
MTASPVAVILVHGWNSHPGILNRLIPRPDAAHIPCSRFSRVEMADKSLPSIARLPGTISGTGEAAIEEITPQETRRRTMPAPP